MFEPILRNLLHLSLLLSKDGHKHCAKSGLPDFGDQAVGNEIAILLPLLTIFFLTAVFIA
jgi:hypothetical protein